MSFMTLSAYLYRVGLINPTGPIPRLNLSALILDIMAAATGQDAEVPATTILTPWFTTVNSVPGIARSG